MRFPFTIKQAETELIDRYDEAEKVLQDQDKLEKLLQNLEKKLKKIPVGGRELSKLPVLVSMLKAYTRGTYRTFPKGTLLAIISALVYFVSPIDAIPDFIPGLGFADDAAVIAFCLNKIDSDVQKYQEWRVQQGLLPPNFDEN